MSRALTFFPFALALALAAAAHLHALPSASLPGDVIRPGALGSLVHGVLAWEYLRQYCSNITAAGNLTVCQSGLAFAGDVFATTETAPASAAEELSAASPEEVTEDSTVHSQEWTSETAVSDGYQTGSMADKWGVFVADMAQYGAEAEAFIRGLACRAASWSDLAKEWGFITSSLPPFNSHLPSSSISRDRYTDSVSVYASALGSFASGFSVTAEETSCVARQLTAHAQSLQAVPSGWENGNELLAHVSKLASSISYLSTYATDLNTHVRVWFDNVQFLSASANKTSTCDVDCRASCLKTQAGDIADSAAGWSNHASGMDTWAADWVAYGERFGVSA